VEAAEAMESLKPHRQDLPGFHQWTAEGSTQAPQCRENCYSVYFRSLMGTAGWKM